MKIEKTSKDSFIVIGKEGSTRDGEGLYVFPDSETRMILTDPYHAVQ